MTNHTIKIGTVVVTPIGIGGVIDIWSTCINVRLFGDGSVNRYFLPGQVQWLADKWSDVPKDSLESIG